MINLTETAAAEIHRVMESNQIEAAVLRVGVQGGGCSGFSYSMDFDNEIREHDQTFEQHGITLVCDMKSYLYLNGTTIDYENRVMGGGFKFNNPNSTGSCGCGSSFSA